MNEIKKLSLLIFLTLIASVSVFADGPIFYQRYTADPWGLVYNGRLYLYCSHDRFEPGMRYNMNDITISTDDMKNWTDHMPNGDFTEAVLKSSLDWNGLRQPFIVATENDSLNGVAKLFGHLLTNSAQVFSDVRTYWSPDAVNVLQDISLKGMPSMVLSTSLIPDRRHWMVTVNKASMGNLP